MEFFTDTATTQVSKINLCLHIWGQQLFHVLVVKLRPFGVTCKVFSPNCSLVTSLHFDMCLVPLAVYIDLKHLNFHFVLNWSG